MSWPFQALFLIRPSTLFLFFIIFPLLYAPCHCNSNYDEQLAKFDQLRINENNYGSVKGMHLYLYNTAIKAVIGHMGRRLYRSIDDEKERRLLASCLDNIEDKNDLVKPAKCITTAKERFKTNTPRQKSIEHATPSFTNVPIGKVSIEKQVQRKSGKYRSIRKPPKVTPRLRDQPVHMPMPVKLKARKRIAKRSHRPSRTSYDPKVITDLDWANKIGRPTIAVRTGVPRAKPLPVKSMDRLESLKYEGVDKSPITRLTDLIRGFFLPSSNPTEQGNSTAPKTDPNWLRTYDLLKKLKRDMDSRMRYPGAMVGEKRMYDIVLDRAERTPTPSERSSPAAMVSIAIEWISSWPGGGQNPGSNKRTLSPRFMPIVKNKQVDNGVHSPSLFALYEDDEDTSEQRQNIASVPNLLKVAGISSGDKEKIISTLIDVSGTTGFVDNAMTVLKELNFLSPDVGGPITDARERMVSAFKSLENSFLPHQKHEFDTDGMTFVGRSQVEKLLFKDQQVLNLAKEELDLDEFDRFERMTKQQREDALWSTIEHIASNASLDELTARRRARRQAKPINWLQVLEPVILSPYAFSPTFGASVLGPLVLSPFIFSPIILQPSVLSPFILSPTLGSPYILSPYVLGPFILSPFGMMPFILSPYVLSPNILSPYMLSPMVLSPIAASPNILSPGTLSPTILSPTALSPDILGNSSLSPAVLSPTFLS